jgi:hypothetical protein
VTGQRKMSQSDFEFLAVQNELADERLSSKAPSVENAYGGKQSVFLTQDQTKENTSKKMYAQIHINDEVHALIATSETSNLVTATLFDSMDLDVAMPPVSQSIFDPIRRLDNVSPPKRYYRTFWRSVSRRILAMSIA